MTASDATPERPVVVDRENLVERKFDPRHEAVYLRRAANAFRNMAGSSPRHQWAAWVPTHLDGLADRLDAIAALSAPSEPGGEVETLRRQVAELERDLDQAMAERDHAQEWADKLAYSIAPIEVIGEHSSGNDPWWNALHGETQS